METMLQIDQLRCAKTFLPKVHFGGHVGKRVTMQTDTIMNSVERGGQRARASSPFPA